MENKNIKKDGTQPIVDMYSPERDEFVNAAVPEEDESPKMDSYAIPSEPESYEHSLDDNAEPVQTKGADIIDFSSADFEKTRKLITNKAQLNSMRDRVSAVRKQKHEIASHSFQNLKNVSVGNVDGGINTPDEVIQYHLDQWESFEKLNKYLEGPVTDKTVKERIESFFEHPETHEVLTLSGETAVKNEADELQFKRGMILHFKQNDEYMAKIDEEVKKLDEATSELTENINKALDLNSNTLYKYMEFLIENSEKATDENILAESYRKYLIDEAAKEHTVLEETELDRDIKKKLPTLIVEDQKRKRADLKKARAIRAAYTLENMIDLVEQKPSIITNSLNDFRSDARLSDIGKRYQSKLKNSKINLDLFGFLSDDPKENLEYKVIPLDEYPVGLEGFTVFFIIRSLSMSLPNKDDEVFHSAIYITLGQIMSDKMDDETAAIMKEGIKKFLSYFEGK